MNERTVLMPIRESHRDLIYTEKASLKRSLHLLIQDKGIEKYNLLLKIYRRIISDYISFSSIESPLVLLGKIITYADEISREESLSTEDITRMSIFITLNSGAEIFILTSSPDSVFICRQKEWKPLAGACENKLINLPLDHTETQRELFSNRLSDFLSLFKLELLQNEKLQVIAGLKESDLQDILKIIRSSKGELDPEQFQRQGGIAIGNLVNKALMVSFSRDSSFFSLFDEASGAADFGGASHRTIPVVLLTAIATLAVLAAAFLLLNQTNSKDPNLSSEGHFQIGNVQERNSPSQNNQAKAMEDSPEEARRFGFVEVWKHPFKMPVTSSPAVFGSRVLFGCRDSNLYCMDWESESIDWNYSSSAGIGASPAIYDNSVICADYKGYLFCLDVENGQKIWAMKLPGKIVSSPVIYNGKVFVGCYDQRIYCLSATNGETLWRYKTSGILRATPTCSSDIVAFASYDGYLYGASIGTGSLRWKYKIGGQVLSSPTSDGKIVVVGGSDGWIHAIDLIGGKRIWTAKTMGPVKSSLLIAGDKVYAGSNDGNLYCIDKSTGSIEWTFRTGDIILSRPLLWKDMMLVASYDKSLYLLDVETGEKVASFQASGSIFSSPVLSKSYVFFGDNEGNFYCLSLREVRSS